MGWCFSSTWFISIQSSRMFVDDTPVRVHRNLTATVPGYQFPSKPAMLIRGSVWDGSDWATDGGQAKVDWSKSPFTAAFQFQGFDATCAVGSGSVEERRRVPSPARRGRRTRASRRTAWSTTTARTSAGSTAMCRSSVATHDRVCWYRWIE